MSIPIDINRMKINSTSPLEHKYLQLLYTIAKKPERLHFIGKLPSTRLTSVAIVGSRKPTSYGKEVTYRLSYELASRGLLLSAVWRLESMASRTEQRSTLAVQQLPS